MIGASRTRLDASCRVMQRRNPVRKSRKLLAAMVRRPKLKHWQYVCRDASPASLAAQCERFRHPTPPSDWISICFRFRLSVVNSLSPAGNLWTMAFPPPFTVCLRIYDRGFQVDTPSSRNAPHCDAQTPQQRRPSRNPWAYRPTGISTERSHLTRHVRCTP